MGRRQKGDEIKPNAKGVYQFTGRLHPGGKREEISLRYKNLKEATAYLDELREGEKVLVKNKGKKTLHDCLDYYENDYVRMGKVIDWEIQVEYLNGFRLHFPSTLYPHQLNEMSVKKSSHLNAWFAGRMDGEILGRVRLDKKGQPLPPGRRKARLKKSSVIVNRAVLVAAINYCHDKGLLTAAEMPKFELMEKKTIGEKAWLTREQWAEFWPLLKEYDSGAHWRNSRKPKPRPGKLPPIYIFACIGLYTGRRATTIEELQWSWGVIDLFGSNPRLNFLPPGTTESSKRKGEIKIPRPLLTVLRQAWHEKENDFVCLSNKSLAKTFAGAAAKAGLDGITPHSLKHTCVTWMLHRGFSYERIGKMVDTQPRTLAKVYGHWDHASKDQIVDEMWGAEKPDLAVIRTRK